MITVKTTNMKQDLTNMAAAGGETQQIHVDYLCRLTPNERVELVKTYG